MIPTMINNIDDDKTPIEIAGAGPAGLAAAITLAQAGRKVVVHEAHKEVGYRFAKDFQGLENWTTKEDVLSVLKKLGLDIDFKAMACRQGVVFDCNDKSYSFNSDDPIFYLVERGSGSDSLDSALLRQACSLGVEIRFNSRLTKMTGQGILAAGPKAADAIAVGFHFETSMENGFWVICDDRLAPKGYSYLLIMDGFGTVKSCMFSGFKQEKHYVKQTILAFERLIGLDMKNPKAHGGTGNFRIPDSAYSGIHPLVGEQAGFQDTMWGFGMRLAITSGVLAAQSILTKDNYDKLWKRELKPQLETSVVNRALFSMLGNTGYRWFFRRLSQQADIRSILRRQYLPSWYKQLLKPWAKFHYISKRKDKTCDHLNCECVWCRSKC